MAPTGLFQSDRSFRLALPVISLLYLGTQAPRIRDLFATGSGLSPDDAMRIVGLRDLLGGQGWYDLVQHRVLPPDGLSMHWSRYIDAPMAAILAPLQALVGPDTGARLLATVWPLAMGLVFLLLTAWLTRRLFGNQAAILALLAVAYYEQLSGAVFGAGATDHHSAQVNLMLALAAMLALPDRPLSRGVAGGLLAALSLAVGLEMILAIALAGAILVAAWTMGRQGAAHRLLGFSAAMALAAPLLMAGQLSPALWRIAVCDALSPPLLAVTTAAFLCSAALVTAGRRLHRPATRGAAIIATGAITTALLYPLIRPCLAGPYTAMSAELQQTVLAQIEEIKPASFFLANDPARVIILLLPFYIATLLFTLSVLARRGQGVALLAFVLAGAILSFWQVRMLTMGIPLVALAFGAGGSWALSQAGTALRVFGALAILATLGGKPLASAYLHFTADPAKPPPVRAALSDDCATIDALRPLDAAPAGIIFNPLNLGPLILLSSHHSITSAPYHRSPDAFANGLLPFAKDEATLHAAIRKTGANYLLVCKGDVIGPPDSIGSRLSAGATPPWLAEMPVPSPHLRLLQVLE